MIVAGVFEVPAYLLSWLYGLTNSYMSAIALVAVVVMVLVTPLILKSTKGMLEMQRLAPEMRKLQQEYRSDRQQLNQEMMKLYQEHKVNPMASCLPMLAQMPVFFIMFQILHGMTYTPSGGDAVIAKSVLAGAGQPVEELGFYPRYLSRTSELYQSLVGQHSMTSLGLDLSVSPAEMLGQDFARGLLYALLVAALGGLYFAQQRMVAARAAISPTMSASQQKLMQYLPVVFAVFQIFFLLALVVYYMVQTVLRILQQAYITRRFYGTDESLGRQAQQASARGARELAQADGGGSPLTQAKRDLAKARDDARAAKKSGTAAANRKSGGSGTNRTPSTKRTTAPKNRPTPAAKQAASRPGNRPSSAKKRKRS